MKALLISLLLFSMTTQAREYGCNSIGKADAIKTLEAEGFVKTRTFKTVVFDSCVNGTCQSHFESAFEYREPSGWIAYATCKGLTRIGLKDAVYQVPYKMLDSNNSRFEGNLYILVSSVMNPYYAVTSNFKIVTPRVAMQERGGSYFYKDIDGNFFASVTHNEIAHPPPPSGYLRDLSIAMDGVSIEDLGFRGYFTISAPTKVSTDSSCFDLVRNRKYSNEQYSGGDDPLKEVYFIQNGCKFHSIPSAPNNPAPSKQYTVNILDLPGRTGVQLSSGQEICGNKIANPFSLVNTSSFTVDYRMLGHRGQLAAGEKVELSFVAPTTLFLNPGWANVAFDVIDKCE